MSIIYSYPEQEALNANDMLIGTSTEVVGGKQKNITRNFSIQQVADFIRTDDTVLNPAASDFQISVFNQGGTKLTGSIMSQNAYPNGSLITITGGLTTTGNISTAANLSATGIVSLGSNQNLISLNSQTRLNGPILDTTGTIGALNQVLLSDSTGVVRWQNYEAGLTYEGTWDATNNTTNGLANSPALISGQGVSGHFYIVNVAGNVSLDGNNSWHVGDWAVFLDQGGQPASWQKIDNTSTLVGSGTAGVFAKWTDATTLNDSLMSQLGANILIDGGLKVKDTVEATTTNSNLKLKGNGTGGIEIMSADGVTDGKIQLNCSQNSHGVTIQSPAHAANATYTLVLPTTSGVTGDVLTSGGVSPSQLTWTTPATGTVTGTGTTSTLPIWSDGTAGVLGDSVIAQVAGGLAPSTDPADTLSGLFTFLGGASTTYDIGAIGSTFNENLFSTLNLTQFAAGDQVEISNGTSSFRLTLITQGAILGAINGTVISGTQTGFAVNGLTGTITLLVAVAARITIAGDATVDGDFSTQGLEVNKYLTDGAGNKGTDGQVLTSTTVAADKEIVWTTPTVGTVTNFTTVSTAIPGITTAVTNSTTTPELTLSITGTPTASLFLDGTGNWSSPGGGVTDITATAPLNADAATGSVTLSMPAYVTATGGYVPSGGTAGQYLDGLSGSWTTLPAGDTYTLGSSTDGSNVKLNLDAASGTDSAITLTGAGGLTVAQTNNIVTLTAPAGSDTTYTLAAGVKSLNSVPLNLSPSTGSDTTVNLTEGTGITLTRNAAGNDVTITTTAAIGSFLPLAGGTLSGALSGTSATFTDTVSATTFSGNLNGTINTLTTGVTQQPAVNNTTIATTAFANAAAAAAAGAGVTSVATANADLITIAGTGSGPYTGAVTATANTAAVSSSSSNLATGSQIQTAIDTALAGTLTFKGTFNATSGFVTSGVNNGLQLYSGNAGVIAITQGDFYIADTAGSFYNTTTMNVGDEAIALFTVAAAPPGSAITDWSVVPAQSSGGTVTSVGLSTDAAALTVTNTPVTGSGTLTLNRNGGTAGQYIDGASGAWTDLPAPGTGTVTGTGATNRVAFWNTSTALTSDVNLYWDNTNDRLGIGTTSPDTKLHIESTSITNSPILTIENDDAKQIELGVVRSAAGSQPNTSFLAYDGDFRFIAGAGSTNEVMRIDSNGKVGIGATGIFTTNSSLNIDGTGLAIKNDLNGGSNNWSFIKNTSTASSSNIEFTTGSGQALILNHDKTATFLNSLSGTNAAFSGSITFNGSSGGELIGRTDQDLIIRAKPTTGNAAQGVKLYNNNVLNASFLEGGNARLHGYGATPNVRSGTATWSLAVDAGGTIIQEPISGGGTVTGTGTATQVAFWDTTSNINSDAAFNWDNTNKRLGVGPGAPAEQLYVNASSGDARIGLNAVSGSDTEIKFSNAGVVQYSIGHDDATDNFVIGTTNVDTPKVSISKAGNSTFAGNVTLDDTNARLKIKSGVAGTNGGIDWLFNGTSTQYARIDLAYDTRSTTGLLIDSAYPMTMDFTDGFVIQEGSSSNKRLVIDTNGNVGIGTANPSAYSTIAPNTNNLVVFDPLDVGITIATSNDVDGLCGINFADGTGPSGSASYIGRIEYSHSDNSMRFDTAATEKMRILNDGQINFSQYNQAAAFTGTSVANLAVDSSGNIITEAAGGSSLPTKTVANTPGTNNPTVNLGVALASTNTAYVDLYVDGVYQNKNTFTVTTGGILTLNSSATFPAGVSIETVTTT